MSEKIKDAVVAEANSARAASQEVVKSGAYLYPFKVSESRATSVIALQHQRKSV